MEYSKEISRFILHYPQENVLKIEKNISLNSIFDSIKSFMELKNVKKVFEAQLINSEKNIPNSVFEKSCPVALKFGRIMEGLSEYSIEFMREKYFLSSQNTMEAFIRNPTIYIKVFPTCRIAIIGPTSSGKSTMAKVFKKIFVGEVVHVENLFENAELREREILYPEALNVVLEQIKEENFQILNEKIKEWKKNIIEIIKKNAGRSFFISRVTIGIWGSAVLWVWSKRSWPPALIFERPLVTNNEVLEHDFISALLVIFNISQI